MNVLPSICMVASRVRVDRRAAHGAPAVGGDAFTTDIAVAIMPATSPTFAGTISVLVVLREVAERATYCSATLRFTAPNPPGLAIASATCRIAFAFASAIDEDRRGLALRLVDLGLLLAFGAGDRRLALAVRDVDLLLAPAFGGRDQRALLALGGDLRLHRAQDLRRRRQVLDLVAQHLDAPVRRRLVERGDDRRVDLVALLEGPVELHLADHAAQRRLRELRDRDDVVRRAVGREPRIGHLEVQDAVDLQLRVVLGDADLARTSSGISRKSCR